MKLSLFPDKNARITRYVLLLCILLLFLCTPLASSNAYAESAHQNGTLDSYQPLHVAILMDASNSLTGLGANSSDPDLVSREAAKAFLNCIPSNRNMVALYHYNTVCQQDKKLTPVSSMQSISELNDTLSGMKKCEGDTHMLSAIEEANRYLADNSDDQYKNVIIVFTDGAENGMLDEQSSDREIVEAVDNVLHDTDTVIYSVAFDYVNKTTGNPSISKNSKGEVGYGKKILKELADKTGGKVMETSLNDINALDDQFLEIINDLCNIRSEVIDEYEGDGRSHKTLVPITDAVIEADLRISCDTLDAAKKARIILEDPEGNKFSFSGTGSIDEHNIWYNTDRLAMNIKIIAPSFGDWKLTVDGIKSDSPVYIRLISQYNMSMDYKITTPSGNLSQVPLGDDVTVEVRLKSDDSILTNPYFYDLHNMQAYAFVTEGDDIGIDFRDYDSNALLDHFENVLKNRPHTETFPMESTGSSFRVNIPMVHQHENILGIWIGSQRFYCYADEPLYVTYIFEPVKDKEFEDIELKTGEQKTIGNLSLYASDPKAKIELLQGDGETVEAKCSDDGSTLSLTGKKVGQQELVLQYTSLVDSTLVFEKRFKTVVVNSVPSVSGVSDLSLHIGDTHTENALRGIVDNDGDVLTVNNVHSDNPNVADVSMNGQTLTIKAKATGSASVVIEVTDGFSVVRKTLKVTVHHTIWFWLLLILLFLAAVVVLALLMRWKHKKNRRFHTILNNVTFRFYPEKANVRSFHLRYPVNLPSLFPNKGETNLKELIDTCMNEPFSENVSELIDFMQDNEERLAAFGNIKMIGSIRFSDPDTFKGSDSHVQLRSGISVNSVINVTTLDHDKFEWLLVDDNESKTLFEFTFETEALQT